MVSAFPPDIQTSVCGQLADCLIAVVAQRLKFHEGLGIRVPVCEVLTATTATRNLIRQGQFFKLASALETSHAEGNWTFRRYQEWLDQRERVYVPTGKESLDPNPTVQPEIPVPAHPPELERAEAVLEEASSESASYTPPPEDAPEEDVIVIDEPDEASLSDLLKKMGGSGKGRKKPPSKESS
jgi:twitching motility protein PilT